MVDVANLNPQLTALLEEFRRRYPDVAITSGYRSPEYNAKVGGAKGSQHLGGNAFDFSVKGLDEGQQKEIAEFLRGRGARGFGYYPSSQSMHADLGSPRYWGPNKSYTSLNQTPEWFQQFAGVRPAAPPTQTAQAMPTPAPQQAMSMPNLRPTTAPQPSFAQRVQTAMQSGTAAPWTQAMGIAPTTANTMGNIGGLLAAFAGGAGQPVAQAPAGYENRPDLRKLEELFGGLLA